MAFGSSWGDWVRLAPPPGMARCLRAGRRAAWSRRRPGARWWAIPADRLLNQACLRRTAPPRARRAERPVCRDVEPDARSRWTRMHRLATGARTTIARGSGEGTCDGLRVAAYTRAHVGPHNVNQRQPTRDHSLLGIAAVSVALCCLDSAASATVLRRLQHRRASGRGRTHRSRRASTFMDTGASRFEEGTTRMGPRAPITEALREGRPRRLVPG
mmetsp:Transcript_47602/g.132737  ORF Transcript_47602/g.132737 Transcript_47602/m.132737 type:complete len:215 (-) Transcript_47602:469-1113(-)